MVSHVDLQEKTAMQSQADLNSLMQQAVAALQAGRAAEARDTVTAIIRQGVDNASVWGVMALACRDMGDHEATLVAADRSLAHEPNNPRAYIAKADAFYAVGKRRAAAAFYRDSLKFGVPRDQCAPDMLADLQRAEARVAELNADFARHIGAHIDDYIAAAGGGTERIEEAVAMLNGRRQLYYPQPHHFFFPGLPVVEFADPADFDWVPAVEAAADDIRAELDALLAEQAEFGAYLSGDDDRPVYDTHGMKDNRDWGAFYLWYNGKPVPENQARCPKTTAVMEQVPLVFSGSRCPNVLFSRLKAGAAIPPHTGMVNTRYICHLPLIVPDNCGFRVGNDVRAWEPGKVWLFDDTMEHEAWNRSQEDRVILIFEVWKPELSETERGLVTRLLEAVDSYSPAENPAA
jgi:aspartate beta-hydroxylase